MMTKSKLWLAVVAGMAAAWAGCTKKNPHKCNAEEPCTLVEAPFCDIDGTIGGTPYRCVALPMSDGGPGALAVDRGTQDFGALPVGQTSSPSTLTITNTGSVATGTLATSIGGAQSTAFVASADTCMGQPLAPAATCTVTLTFTPAAGGAAAGTLTVAGVPGGAVMVTLTGSGVAPGAVSLTPPSADFGSVVVANSSATTTFTVANPGAAPTGMLSTALGGADAAHFMITSDGCAGQVLAGGASCTLTARFSPTNPGSKNATLTVTPTGASSTTATLTGMGLIPGEISISPAARDFGSLPQGDTTGTPFTFTVTNGGQSPTGSLTVSLTGGDASQFSITSNGCMGMMVPAAGTCTVAVRFNPTTAGAKSASLTITGTPGGSVTAPLSGTGLSPPALSLSPGTQNFGDVITGNNSTQVFTLTNTGGVASGVPAASLGGADMGMFSVSSNTCTTTLAPAASCNIGVRFQPTSTGAKVGTLNISATPGGAALAMLSGNGIPPSALTFTPANLDLGNQLQGTSGTPMRLTVTNTGGATSGAVTVALGGTAAGEFAIAAQTCNGMTLAPAGTCTVDISFRPTSRGSKNASLNLTASPGGPAAASLMGTGQSPALLAVLPTSNAFGNVPTGSSSSAATFTITNSGDVNSGVPAVTLGGTHMNQFSTSANGCTTALAPGGMCTVRVTFSPTSLGAKSANLTITASPGGAPAASLDGTGVMPGLLAFSPSTYNFTSTVAGTQSATHMFTLSNGGGAATGAISTSITGTQANQFTIVTDGCTGMTLPAAGSCNIVARFDPTGSGAKSASLSATASPGGTINSTLNGTGLAQAVLSLSPPSQGFGSVPIGSSSAPITFTVTNNGEVVSGSPVVSKSGTDAAAFTISNNNCTSGIAASSSCTFQVTFNSTGSAGSRSASVTVTASPGGAPSSTLSAMAVAPGLLVMSPTSSDFGSSLIGATNQTRMFTLTNNGGAPTTAIGLSITPAGQFSIVSGMDTCSGAVLAASGTCTVTLRFSPTSAGAKTATFTATASTGGTDSSNLTGLGQNPAQLAVNPLSFGYGNVTVNTTATQTFTVSNTGDVPTGAPSVSVTGTGFTLMTNNCTLAIPASPGSCTVVVAFTPTVAMAYSGNLNLSATPGGGALPAVALSGTGLTAGALSINPTSKAYASTVINTASAAQSFTVTNTGGSTTPAITVSITGSDQSQFIKGADTCNGNTLGAGLTCTISVPFNPTSVGAKSASLTASLGATSATASLSGTGLTQAVLSMSSPTQDFGNIPLGSTSAPIVVTVTNSGQVVSGTPVVSKSGTDATQFTITNNNCTTGVAAGSTCTFQVTLTPTGAVGSRTVTLTTTASPGGAPSMALSGAAVEPGQLVMSPTSRDFGSSLIGATDQTRTFTLTNMGGAPTTAISLSITPSTEFSIVSGMDACSGQTLAGAGTCMVTLRFNPTSAGTKNATFSATATTGGTDSSTLTGVGQKLAQLAVNPSSFGFPSITVNNTSTQTFTVSNTGDVPTGTPSVSVSGAPFSVMTNNCTAAIPASPGSCTVVVAFTPTAATSYSGSLNLSATPGGGALPAVALTGTGLSVGVLSINPTSKTFDTTVINNVSAAQSFTVTNTGGSTTPVIAVSLTGSDQGQFTIGTDTCNGNTLGAGLTCTISVTFNPTSPVGSKSASLSASLGATSAIATLGGQAIQCTTNSHCPGATPICSASNTCGACTADAQCTDSLICLEGSGACQPEPETIYLATSGVDGTCNASRLSPCRTLAKAKTFVTPTRKMFYLSGGVYPEFFDWPNTAGVTMVAYGATLSPGASQNRSAIVISAGNGPAQIEGLTITGATGGTDSHGLQVTDTGLTLTDVTIRGNGGGGIVATNPPNVIGTRVNLENNDFGLYASDVNLGGVVSLSQGRITGNARDAVYSVGSAIGLDRMLVQSNGTGLFVKNAWYMGLTHSFVVQNGTGTSGIGGLYLQNDPGFGTSGNIAFSTVAANIASGTNNGGIVCINVGGIGSFVVSNSIVYSNTGAVQVGNECPVFNSDVKGRGGENGSIDADPQFVAPASGFFTIQSTSPCRSTASGGEGTRDYYGTIRPQGPGPDMGAHEIP
ncbi:MAG: choice-of-anchor D domain-containing protein [Deltaproteobacteria bacterium]|nr:choice-of-anchor D domain-containing protein [Deltaproteobacteria bacterium]